MIDLFDNGPAANDTPRKFVTLADGQVVDSASEEWRFECEARYINRLPGSTRREFLGAVATKRGADYTQALQRRAMAVRLYDEACKVAELPTVAERRAHLLRVEYNRGADARRQLESEVKRVWRPKAA